jgi:hypothetical protein
VVVVVQAHCCLGPNPYKSPCIMYSTHLHVKAGGEVLAEKGDKGVGLRLWF